MIIKKVIPSIQSDEQLEREINLLKKYKLMKSLGIKIDKNTIEKALNTKNPRFLWIKTLSQYFDKIFKYLNKK